jgi:hypothetical protein
MPPQPLRLIRPDAGLLFAPEATIERPEVGAWIAQCIACWSWVETQTSRLLVQLAAINVQDGVELYNDMRGASLKESSIRILARARLPKSDFSIIDALLQVIRSNQKTRDKIAHCAARQSG